MTTSTLPEIVIKAGYIYTEFCYELLLDQIEEDESVTAELLDDSVGSMVSEVLYFGPWDQYISFDSDEEYTMMNKAVNEMDYSELSSYFFNGCERFIIEHNLK